MLFGVSSGAFSGTFSGAFSGAFSGTFSGVLIVCGLCFQCEGRCVIADVLDLASRRRCVL